MDISNAIIAKSDQLNAVDLISGPRTVSIVDVHQGPDDQPVNIITDVFGKSRPFRPSKTVLRVLGKAWGTDTAPWVGRRMEIYRDPSVRWAGEEVGGIRISGLSHIDKPLTFSLPTSKGKHGKSVVQPLPDAAPQPRDESGRDWIHELELAGDDIDAVQSLGKAARAANADGVAIAAMKAKWDELKAAS